MHQDDEEYLDRSLRRERRKLGKTEQLTESIDPRDKRSMELLHKRVRERALSLRWNLNGLMFVYAVLIIIVILTIQNINSLLVALVSVIGLLLIWLYSSSRLKKLEKQFYQQEIHDYVDLLSAKSQYSFDGGAFVSGGPTKPPLTLREIEILTHMASGKRNKDIAYALNISESTVKNHIGNIYNKLEIYDRMTVVLLAIRSGWIKYDSQNKFHPKSSNTQGS